MGKEVKAVLGRLLMDAEQRLGEFVSWYPGRGLVVDVSVTVCKTQLRMWRQSGAAVSIEIWARLIGDWPYPLRVEPIDYVEDGRVLLSASWPTPPRLEGM